MSGERSLQPPGNSAAPPSSGGALQGERHVSEVAGRAPLVSKKAGVGVIVGGAVIACGVILLTSSRPQIKEDEGPKVSISPAVAYVPPPPSTPAAVTTPVPPKSPVPRLPTQAPTSLLPSLPKAADRLLVYNTPVAPNSGRSGPAAVPMSPSSYGTASGSAGAAGNLSGSYGMPNVTPASTAFPSGPGAAQAGGNDLAARLTPTPLTGVSATVLRHQPFLLTQGTIIPCILQTAMDSTLPGFVTCVIPQDVLGKTGLTLLDRGTKVVGEFRGGIRQGVERMFVIWTRAETPQGVIMNLDSPATDALGRSGMEGAVDRHFWQRFGGALLLSTVEGAIQAGVAQASKEGTTTINTGSTESVVAEALAGTINIPPTVRKNQGELVSIYVARDLDFATVYRVQPSTQHEISASRTGGGR